MVVDRLDRSHSLQSPIDDRKEFIYNAISYWNIYQSAIESKSKKNKLINKNENNPTKI